MVNREELVEAGSFVTIEGAGLAEEHGIKDGDLLYIAGDGFAPVDTDGYDYRRVFVVTKMDGDHIDVESKGYAVDGKWLTKVAPDVQEALSKIKDEDFSEAEEVNS